MYTLRTLLVCVVHNKTYVCVHPIQVSKTGITPKRSVRTSYLLRTLYTNSRALYFSLLSQIDQKPCVSYIQVANTDVLFGCSLFTVC